MLARIPVSAAPEAPAVAISVVGVGGAGGNVVDHMAGGLSSPVTTVALNTDRQALGASRAARRVVLGEASARGMGAGGDPGAGQRAAEESAGAIHESLRGADLVFIAAGLGGGTGTGAAPVVAAIARELGALTVALVTRPFGFEGRRRAAVAEQGIAQLRAIADTVVVVPNDRLVQLAARTTSIAEAFGRADSVLRLGVQGIADLMLQRGLINVDFADVRAVMGEAGPALLGIGVGQGPDRTVEAARRAMACPLLEGRLEGARRLLLNISGGDDLGLLEVHRAAELVGRTLDPDANIIFGAALDPSLKAGLVKVTLVATAFGEPRGPEARQPVAVLPRPVAAAAPDPQSLDMPPFLLRFREQAGGL
jgi:cell division protein FtsZ